MVKIYKQSSKIKKILIIILIIVLDIGVSLYLFRNRTQNVRISSNKVIENTVPAVKENNIWSMLITGDVIPARSVNWQMTLKNDFMWPLRGIKDILQSADLTLINLESPLISNCPITNEGMKFCGDTRFAQSLKTSGVDVVNLANNHSLNYGWEGLGETEKLLNNLGIDTVGYTNNVCYYSSNPDADRDEKLSEKSSHPAKPDCVGRQDSNNNVDCSSSVIKVVQNIKVGFLGYNTVGQQLNRELVSKQITDLRKSVDIIVISIHWGKEYTQIPEKEAEDPKELGRWFIDSGADIIVGNHPHVIQPFEFYGKGVIFYAMGNTVFDQEWSSETKKGNLVKLNFLGKQLQNNKIEIIPIGIRNYGEAFIP